jgi:hypothetical protein
VCLPAGLRPVLAFLCLTVFFVVPAHAAESGGTIRVHVLAPDRADVSTAVVVTLTTATEPGRVWTARVEPGGLATFRNLPTATYHVTVAPDGGPGQSLDVVVVAATLADLETRFSAHTASLTLASSGRLGHGLTFADRTLTDLPGSMSVWGLLDASEPFVIVDRMDTGGLLTGQSGLVGSRGASWTTATISFDAIDVVGPTQTGRFGLVPDLAAVAAVDVTTGLAPIDVGAPGASIALEPKRPGPDPHGEVRVAATTTRMAGRNDSPFVPSIDRLDSWSSGGGEFGAPITPRLGVFAVVDATQSEQQTRLEPFKLPGNLTSGFGHVVLHPRAADEIRAFGSFAAATTAYDGRDQFANRDVTEGDSSVLAEVAWDHLGGAGRRFVSVGVNQAGLSPKVTASMPGGIVDRVFDGVMPDPPSKRTMRQTTATFEFDPHDVAWGGLHHAIRLGGTVDERTQSATVLDLPTVAETVDELPARLWVTQAPARASSGRHIADLTAFASDTIQLASRLTADVGVRANLTSGSADGAPTGISWKTLAPRAALRWAPDALTFFAAYSRYYAPLSLDWLAFGDPGVPTAKVFRWTDPNGDGLFEPGEQGPLIALTGWGQGVGAIDPALQAPRTDEVTLGVERWVNTTVRLHAAATFRHETNLAAPVDVGVPTSSYATFTILDQGEDYFGSEDDRPLTIYNRLPASFGQDHYVLTNPVGDTARYEGMEISAEVHGTHLSAIVGAMAYLTRAGAASPGFTALENDQDVLGQRFLDPNGQPYEPGSIFFDRSYVLKWSTIYEGSHGLHAAVVARYQDGEPFTRLVVAPTLNQGPEVIQAYRTGRTRFLYTVTIDAEVAQAFRIGHGREIQLTVGAFNLLNQANEVEENPVTGPTFRDTTAVQPPRTIRVGLKVRF